MRAPKDISEDRSFMGLVQYAAKFMPARRRIISAIYIGPHEERC